MSSYLQKLLDSTADAWNAEVAASLGTDPEQLTNIISARQTLTLTEDKISVIVNQEKLAAIWRASLNEFEESQGWYGDSSEGLINPVDRFVHKANKKDAYTMASMSCVGKVIAGVDFARTDIEVSYFNGCTFFNCTFSDSSFTAGMFINCVFNMCDMSEGVFDNSEFARCRFLDCVANNSSFENVTFSDVLAISFQIFSSSLHSCKMKNVGFTECMIGNSNMRASMVTVSSFISCNFVDTDASRAAFIDVTFIRLQALGLDLTGSVYNSVTANSVEYDGKNPEFFDMGRGSYSLAVREWETFPDEEAVDEYIEGLGETDPEEPGDVLGDEEEDDD